MKKNWRLNPKITPDLQNQFPEINPIVLQLLDEMGINTQEKIDEFWNPDYGQDLHNPFLFLDMEKAVKRIFKAIKKEEKILIWGDYDADGVTSSAVLYSTLKKLGAQVEVYLPDRELEGCGLNIEGLKKLKNKKIKLIITVDCGISNAEEAELVKKLGIDLIITDHHSQPLKLPKAYAIINPKLEKEKYPFRELAGVGVAFKLAQALLKESKIDIEKGFEKWLLDLVALGTVADCEPLLGENRTLVKYGLVVLNKTRRLGLQELIKISNLNNLLDSEHISFQLGPRLNAASRMDHANTAFELLTTESEKEAREIAKKLNQINQQRQLMIGKIMQEAKEQIKGEKDKKIIIVESPKKWFWPVGIIGLVAGRLQDELYKPVIVITKIDKKGLQGSSRSVPEFNIVKALQECGRHLLRYGGHPEASGFSLEENKLSEFKEEINKIAERELKNLELFSWLKINAKLDLGDINWDLQEELEKFEPFGESNKKPKFLSVNLQITGLEKLGKNEQHLKLSVIQSSFNSKKFIGFGLGKTIGSKLKIGDMVDIVFELGVNEWNGNKELQMKIIEIDITNIK
ncbi:MAG: single-stranded-DNA-specific exonuclease [Parcubacteria group bacterium Athens1014_10]|nr:MAG: single-stranded-DNA-specific exonuclease [Parcubacteria group bacterium Athens1014_10]